ncbi:MAG TPA: dienelactone hydrolase family protein [Chloroflexota bacterium]|nr:dienelactone hydrolase family protein [Chloroflexota bacterium]
MAGQMVAFPSNGGTAQGYLAKPASGRGPGVLVIQEWWGLVDHIKDVAERFAAEGFVALAPDLYHGQATSEPDEAGKLMMALNIDQAARDLRGAAQYLLREGSVTSRQVGVVGFCMGGQLALYAATVAPDEIGAVADFYGIHPNVQPDLSKLKAPVLGAFAEQDGFVPVQAVRELEAKLRAQGVETDFKIYAGTQHAFFNDTRPEVYNESAARDAWGRTVNWFRKHLQ